VAFSSADFLLRRVRCPVQKTWGHHLVFDDGPETLRWCCARRPSSICYAPYDDRGNSYDGARYDDPQRQSGNGPNVRDGAGIHKNRHQDNRMWAGKSISPI